MDLPFPVQFDSLRTWSTQEKISDLPNSLSLWDLQRVYLWFLYFGSVYSGKNHSGLPSISSLRQVSAFWICSFHIRKIAEYQRASGFTRVVVKLKPASKLSWECVTSHTTASVDLVLSFSGGLVVKYPRANTGDSSSVPGSGRSTGEGNANPLQYCFLGNPMDRETWWAKLHGVTWELDTT